MSIRGTPVEIVVALAMFSGITFLRFAAPNSVEAITFLYVLPIGVLAVDFAIRGGLLGAGLGTVLLGWWTEAQDTPNQLFDLVLQGIVFILLAGVLGSQSKRRRKLEAERDALIGELQAMAIQDKLTGLPNRRGWDERFAHELERARRSGEPLTVVAIDLDNLKQINDRQGHAAGDDFIVTCAAAWEGALRGTDFVARLGGDEFLAVLPNCPQSCARTVIERAFRSAPDNAFSVGTAVWDRHESGIELVRRADEALYEAKNAGRGRVVVARDSGSDDHATASSA